MNRYIMLSIVLATVVMATHSVVASDKFLIYVYDSSGNTVKDAVVEVWDGNNKVDSGTTDSDGIFTTWLDRGITYSIKASEPGQFGEYDGFPPNLSRIDIHMISKSG